MIPLAPLLWLLLFAGLLAAIGVYVVLMVLLAADPRTHRANDSTVVPRGSGATAREESRPSAVVIALERRR